MMLFTLYDTQAQDLANIRAAFKAGRRSVLYVAPTGSGKTVTSAHIINGANQKGNENMFLAHRREIIYQTGQKLEDAGIEYNLVLAGHKRSMSSMTWLASVQTLIRRDFPNVKFIIIDEAHHAVATTYQRILAHYPDARILGLTATPCRADGRGLGGVFQHMVVGPTVSELIEKGRLVPPRIFWAEIPDLSNVKIKRGDYDQEEIGHCLDNPKLVGDIVENWVVNVGCRPVHQQRTLGFFTNISHSLHAEEAFNNAGIKAEHLDGETPTDRRASIWKRHRSGETLVVCNVGVATEGYDDPGIHSVIMARKTKSFGLYLQMAGRGLRPDPKTDKHELILLDHADNLGEHGSPDEPVAWSLDPDRPAAQHTEETKKQSKVGRQWRCSLCFYVNDGGTHCGRCGMQRQRDAKTPEVAKGRLIEVDRKRQVRMGRDDAERIWQECLWKSIHKGLKVGAAAHMYRKETGKWPRGFAGMPRGSEWQMNAADFHRQQRGL